MTVKTLFQINEQQPINDIVKHIDVSLWGALFQQISHFLDCPAVALILTTDVGYQNIAMSIEPGIKANLGKIIPREVNIYCKEVYETKKQLYVQDASRIEKWQDNPEYTVAGLISYIGFPIFSHDGSVFATLCALNNKVVKYNVSQIELMECIRDIIQREVQSAEKFEDVLNTSYHDELSGVLNRRGVIEKFNILKNTNCSCNSNFVLVYFDLDGLKKINDTWGHKVGDIYIQSFGRAIRQSLRNSDIVGRLGGDEFVALCCGVEAGAIEDLIQRIRERYEAICQALTTPCNASFSSGSAYYSQVPQDIETALEKADSKMYKQKKQRYESSKLKSD